MLVFDNKKRMLVFDNKREQGGKRKREVFNEEYRIVKQEKELLFVQRF